MNIATCCKKMDDNALFLDYTSKFIELEPLLEDKNLILKAYLRRGLTYEKNMQFNHAKQDMESALKLHKENKQA